MAERKNVLVIAKNIVKKFPGVVALKNVTFDIRKGEIHGLLGQNGAGKSTLVKVIYGVHKPDSGKIYVKGKEVRFSGPADARRHGIVLVNQEITVVPNLTVMENIFLLGRLWKRNIFSKLSYNELREKTEKIIGMLGIDIDPNMKVKDLRAAEKMIVQISAALTMDAEVILLDEPTSPLPPEEVNKLFDVMTQLRERGLGIVFITHRVKEALEICDRITVLRNGVKLGTLEGEDKREDKLVRLMLGIDPNEFYKVRSEATIRKPLLSEKPILEIRDLSTIPSSPIDVPLKNINLKVYPNEIHAVVGLVGAGKSELGKTLIGLQPIAKGEIIIKGKRVHIKSPVDALKYRIYYLPEDRKTEGLIPNLHVIANKTISSLRVFTKLLFIDHEKEYNMAMELAKRLNIVMPSPYEKVIKLSGGNQQKVLIARGLLAKPEILIFDEPTVGIDIGAKVEIRKAIYELARKEKITVILLTSDPDEALGVADRITVMRNGEIVANFINENLRREDVIKAMTG